MGLLSLFRWSKKTEQKPQPAKAPSHFHQPPKPESNWEAATVKMYRSDKGFGFLTRGAGQPDIYVHWSTLKRCRIESLTKGQKIEVKWGTAQKGLEAAELRLST